MNGRSPANVSSWPSPRVDLSGRLKQGQQGLGQEERRQTVDLETFPHRVGSQIGQGNVGWKDPGVVDQQVEAMLLSDDALHLVTKQLFRWKKGNTVWRPKEFLKSKAGSEDKKMKIQKGKDISNVMTRLL